MTVRPSFSSIVPAPATVNGCSQRTCYLHRIAAILEDLGEPAHLIGHSYGAVACIEAAVRLPSRVRGLLVIEPVLFHLLRAPGFEAEWRRVSELARRVIEAEASGDNRRAAGIYMG